MYQCKKLILFLFVCICMYFIISITGLCLLYYYMLIEQHLLSLQVPSLERKYPYLCMFKYLLENVYISTDTKFT